MVHIYIYIKYSEHYICALYARVNSCVCSKFVKLIKKVPVQLQLEWQKQMAKTMLTTAKKLQSKNNNFVVV